MGALGTGQRRNASLISLASFSTDSRKREPRVNLSRCEVRAQRVKRLEAPLQRLIVLQVGLVIR